MKRVPLIICIRCHKNAEFISDTIESIKRYTNPNNVQIMLAVDNNPQLARLFESRFPVYCSTKKHGWGAGLYELLCDSILFAEKRFKFSHFVSIDYDTLFIKKGVDEALLEQIDSEDVGLLGNREKSNTRWAKYFQIDAERLEFVYGKKPGDYVDGEGVFGGMFLMTRSLINAMHEKGLFYGLKKELTRTSKIADDHFITYICCLCGLKIKQLPPSFKILWSLDSDPTTYNKTDIIAFHPTKIRAMNKDISIEKKVRTFFKGIRDVDNN